MAERGFQQIDRMFRSNEWEVITVKYGKKLRAMIEHPQAPLGGSLLRRWINGCDNATWSRLTYLGGRSYLYRAVTVWAIAIRAPTIWPWLYGP